jgi:hypothetical protein
MNERKALPVTSEIASATLLGILSSKKGPVTSVGSSVTMSKPYSLASSKAFFSESALETK